MIFGYLDPGSGSLILQVVIGGLTGLGVAVRAFRHKLARRRIKPDPGQVDDGAVEDTALPGES